MYYLSQLLFLDKGFKFQASVCNRCHDVLMIAINLDNITTVNIYSVDYCFAIVRITKSEAINSLRNADLSEKRGSLQNMIFFIMHKKLIGKLQHLVILKLKRYKDPFFQRM